MIAENMAKAKRVNFSKTFIEVDLSLELERDIGVTAFSLHQCNCRDHRGVHQDMGLGVSQHVFDDLFRRLRQLVALDKSTRLLFSGGVAAHKLHTSRLQRFYTCVLKERVGIIRILGDRLLLNAVLAAVEDVSNS